MHYAGRTPITPWFDDERPCRERSFRSAPEFTDRFLIHSNQSFCSIYRSYSHTDTIYPRPPAVFRGCPFVHAYLRSTCTGPIKGDFVLCEFLLKGAVLAISPV